MLFTSSQSTTLLKDLLVAIAETRDSEALLPLVLQRLTQGVPDVALAAIWLRGTGEACATGSDEKACPSPEECLHLAAIAGGSHGEPALLEAQTMAFQKAPFRASDVEKLVSRSESLVVDARSFDLPEALADWFRNEHIDRFWGKRLAQQDRVLGVLGVFLRTAPTQADGDALELVAAQIGIAIANDNTRKELKRLQERLETDSGMMRLRSGKGVLSEADLRRFERENILAALEATRGRVYGRGGAAELLGLKPTTLASRLKKLGISVRP